MLYTISPPTMKALILLATPFLASALGVANQEPPLAGQKPLIDDVKTISADQEPR